MQSSLEVGERVMLTSGIHGTLREVGAETVTVEIAEGVRITVARAAIGQVVQARGRGESDNSAGPADAEES